MGSGKGAHISTDTGYIQDPASYLRQNGAQQPLRICLLPRGLPLFCIELRDSRRGGRACTCRMLMGSRKGARISICRCSILLLVPRPLCCVTCAPRANQSSDSHGNIALRFVRCPEHHLKPAPI